MMPLHETNNGIQINPNNGIQIKEIYQNIHIGIQWNLENKRIRSNKIRNPRDKE
jgi:hypothetical protein